MRFRYVVQRSANATQSLPVSIADEPLTFADRWWNLFAGSYSMDHPFEQHTMQWQVAHLDSYRQRLRTLPLRTMDRSVREAIVHLEHNAGTKSRIWSSARAVAEVICPSGLCSPREQWALSQLQSAPVKGAGRVNHTVRNKALQRMLRSACRSFVERWKPQPTITPFDATLHAQRLLRQPEGGADDLAGLPLLLTNCTEDPVLAPWQTWDRSPAASSTVPLPSGSSRKSVDCDSMLCIDRFRLRHAPSLCLSMGKMRSPHQPYSTLAQLAPCLPDQSSPSQVLDSSLIRGSLVYDPKLGLMRTAHVMRDITRLVPEQRIDCGFWTSCSRTRSHATWQSHVAQCRAVFRTHAWKEWGSERSVRLDCGWS